MTCGEGERQTLRQSVGLRVSLPPIINRSRLFFATLLLLLCLGPAAASTPSCCSLSAAELDKLKGKHKPCPKETAGALSSTPLSDLSAKCEACPAGLCRLGTACYCPENFREQPGLHDKCEPAFGAKWPRSVGKPDALYSGCGARAPKPVPTRLSCCALTAASLERLYGLSESCPRDLSAAPIFVARCDPCPPGMCRARGPDGQERCVCPSLFAALPAVVADDETAADASAGMRDRCDASFGAAWPDSVNKTDKAWESCSGGLGVLEITYHNGTTYKQEADGKSGLTDAKEDDADAEAEGETEGEKPDTTAAPKPEAGSQNDASGASNPTTVDGPSAKQGGGGGGLSGGAIFGIVFAVLVGAVGVGVLLWIWCARGHNRTKGIVPSLEQLGIDEDRSNLPAARAQAMQSNNDWI